MSELNVGFLAGSLSRNGGGVSEVLYALAQRFTSMGMKISAYGLEDSHSQDDRAKWGNVSVTHAPANRPASLGWSPALYQAVRQSDVDILHLHTLWMYTSVIAQRWHQLTRRPVIVTPHGMLEPWAIRNSRWKKNVAWYAYERSNLHRATCLNAHTEKELHDIRQLGVRTTVAVIPNGVDLPSLGVLQQTLPYVLYVGRLHPKKGLAELITGWASTKARAEKCPLVIAGWDQGGYLDTLMQVAASVGLTYVCADPTANPLEPNQLHEKDCDIIFLGSVFGERKSRWLQHARAFALTSHSEGLPIAVLEAWAHSLPVIMSPQCNLPVGFAENAAFETQPTPGDIACTIDLLWELSPAERLDMGSNGRRLVERQFTWDGVATKFEKLYRWTLHGGDRPDFIFN